MDRGNTRQLRYLKIPRRSARPTTGRTLFFYVGEAIVKKTQIARLTLQIRVALVAAAAGFASISAPALATDAPASNTDAQQQAQPATNAQPANAGKTDQASTELGNIIVTAQSRTQQVQEVPIAVQVVTSQQIDKLAATDLSLLNGYLPGVQIDGSQPTQPNFTMRGIGATDFGIGTDAPVSIYENGVYMFKSGAALTLFNDIDHVEVLMGPQGTLFGRNSAAGAISVTTNAPTDSFEASATERLGNYGERYTSAVFNTPLGDDVAFRMSFVDNQSDGWLRNDYNGQMYHNNDDWGTRMQLHWNAPGDTSVNFSWEHERLDQLPQPAINIAPLPAYPELPPPNPSASTYLDPRTTPFSSDTVDPRESRTYDSFVLRVEHSLPFGELTSLTSFQRFNTYNRESYDGTDEIYLYVDTINAERNKSWSQEFKLSGKTDLADWVGGLSYYYDDAHQTSTADFTTNSIDTLFNNIGVAPGGLYGPLTEALQSMGLQYNLLGDPWQENMINHGTTRSYAAYGDVIWHITDKLNLTTGVRFTHDEKSLDWYTPERIAPQLDQTLAALNALGILGSNGIPPLSTFQQNIYFTTPQTLNAPLGVSNTWNNTSPRLVLDYKLTPDVMLYASAAEGYEAGGYNALSPGTEFGPQTVRNYEAGIKSYFSDYHLLLNASVYYYTYSNLPNLVLVSGGGADSLPRYEIQPADERAKGFEVEARWQATDDLRFNSSVAWIDQTYGNYLTTDPLTNQPVNLSGQTTGLPFWSAMAGVDYTVRQVVGGDLDFTLQQGYNGKTRCNQESTAQGNCLQYGPFKLGTPTLRTDLRVGWAAHDVPWSFAFIVNNLFDKRYVTGVSNILTGLFGTPTAGISAPRMYSVEASYRF
jgi:iron complex outermembrane receptor protein